MKLIEFDVTKCKAASSCNPRSCEIACSQTFFKEENPELSSIRIFVEGAKVSEIKVCNQCGKCIDICPVQAISRSPKGTVIINKNQCVGCMACVGFCPTLDMHVHKPTVSPFKCIACGACVKVCEPGALKLVEKVPTA